MPKGRGLRRLVKLMNLLPEDKEIIDELNSEQKIAIIDLLYANISDEMKRGITAEEIMSRADGCDPLVRMAYKIIAVRNVYECVRMA
jgi:hypothetical protein